MCVSPSFDGGTKFEVGYDGSDSSFAFPFVAAFSLGYDGAAGRLLAEIMQ